MTTTAQKREAGRAHPLIVVLWLGLMLGIVGLIAFVASADFSGIIPSPEEQARLLKAAEEYGPKPLLILLGLIAVAAYVGRK